VFLLLYYARAPKPACFSPADPRTSCSTNCFPTTVHPWYAAAASTTPSAALGPHCVAGWLVEAAGEPPEVAAAAGTSRCFFAVA